MKLLFTALRLSIWVSLLISFTVSLGQNGGGLKKVKLHGQIKDQWTGKGISGVSVFIQSLGEGTLSDVNGNYELYVSQGKFTIKFSSVDLDEETHLIDIIADTKFDLEMKEKVFKLDEISIFSERIDANVQSLDLGKTTFDVEKLKSVPAFLGEPDVIKSLILLPGVSTVGEGASGFNVRGGGVDQNLILQDGGLIFNPSHVFGFFSSFNPAIVKDATLYKSGLPARYGGRLSSVLDVQLKEGDFQQYNMNGGIGLVSSNLALDGPLIKDKLSLIVAARVSYSDWLLKLASDPDVKSSTAGFQDFNAKLSYRFNPNNKITYSGYLSNDRFGLASDTIFEWQTTNHALQWTHTFNEKVVLQTDLVSGQYSFTITDPEGINSFAVKSNIAYTSGRVDLIIEQGEENMLNFGVEGILYDFQPGRQSPLDGESGVDRIFLEKEKSWELSFYAEDEYALSEKFSVRAGLRFSMFKNVGRGSDYIYGEGTRETENIIDTVYYSSGETIANYQGLEPRLNLNYKLSGNSSIKASYNRTRQYLHLITNTAAVTPTDLWKTSNQYIQPETGDQYAIGYFRNVRNNSIEVSVEAYYKAAQNIVDFKDGSVLLMNENIESDLINGTSEAYGIEFFVNKKTGRFTSWMSYTFSRIFRTVNGMYEDERINLGEAYPGNYDKPHDVTMSVNYRTSPVLEYGANFTYSTGRPSTAPVSLYDISNQTNVFNFSQRNQQRIPDYHRLDLSMTVHSKPRIDRKWNMSWTFAVYNVYARKNAFSVFYENKYGSPPKAYKLSVLGSAFPSVMLNFKF